MAVYCIGHVPPNPQDGLTPLMFAAGEGHLPVARLLVEIYHCNVNEEDGNVSGWVLIAEPKGEASNRDALSSPICIYVCIICISVPVNPRHLDCAIAWCSPQALTTTKRSTWPPLTTNLLNTPLHRCMLHSDCP